MTLKIAVFAPMPSASVTTTIAEKAGALRRRRSPRRRSWSRVSMASRVRGRKGRRSALDARRWWSLDTVRPERVEAAPPRHRRCGTGRRLAAPPRSLLPIRRELLHDDDVADERLDDPDGDVDHLGDRLDDPLQVHQSLDVL